MRATLSETLADSAQLLETATRVGAAEGAEAGLAQLESEAEADAAWAAEATGGVSASRVAELSPAVAEARQRRVAEEGLLTSLGLLYHACAENGHVCRRLGAPEWLRLLLAWLRLRPPPPPPPPPPPSPRLLMTRGIRTRFSRLESAPSLSPRSSPTSSSTIPSS